MRRRARRRRRPARPASLYRVDPLEPRVLLSADPLGPLDINMGGGVSDLTLRLLSGGVIRVEDSGTGQAIEDRDRTSTTQVRIVGEPSDPSTLRIDASIVGLGLPIHFTGGGSGGDRLFGPDVNSTWTIGAPGQGTVQGVNFSQVEFLEGGTADDTLTLEPFEATTVSLHRASPDTGAVSVDESWVSYRGIETLTDSVTTVNRVISFTDAADKITFADGPTGQLRIESDTVGDIDFPLPSGSLTVRTIGGDDTIELGPLSVDIEAGFFVDGGAGSDTFDSSGFPTSLNRVVRSPERSVLTDGDFSVSLLGVESSTQTGGVVLAELPPWIEQGPGSIGEQHGGLGDGPHVGAVQELAVHPGDDAVIFAGSVNGGVWRSEDTGRTWIPLTDAFPSLSIGALAISPIDADGKAVDGDTARAKLVVYAGTGQFSSGHDGGFAVGLLRSRNGGDTWELLAVDDLARLRITAIVPTSLNGGQTVLLSALDPSSGNRDGGIFRSKNGGVTFENLSGRLGGGLPGGQAFDLVADPAVEGRLYAAIAEEGGPITVVASGIYRTDNGGDGWTEINDGLTNRDKVDRILLAVQDRQAPDDPNVGNLVYAALIGKSPNDYLLGVYRSTPQTGTQSSWSLVGDEAPLPPARFSGSSSNTIEFTAAAGSMPATVKRSSGSWVGDGFRIGHRVFVDGAGLNSEKFFEVLGGDSSTLQLGPSGTPPDTVVAQVLTGADAGWVDIEATAARAGTPSAIQPQVNVGSQGDKHFSMLATAEGDLYVGGDRSVKSKGILFRWNNASQGTGAQTWETIVGGAARLTQPHADSRDLVFLRATGDLLESDDGGVYRLSDPKGERDGFILNSVGSDLRFVSRTSEHPSQIIRVGPQAPDWGDDFRVGRRLWIDNTAVEADGLYTITRVDGKTIDVLPDPGVGVEQELTVQGGALQIASFQLGRFWDSLNNDLRVNEINSVSYDALNDVVFSGNQDNGVAEQRLIRMDGDPEISLASGARDTIARETGDWLEEGFSAGQRIVIARTGSPNDGRIFTVDGVTSEVLTLGAGDEVTPETGRGFGIRVTDPVDLDLDGIPDDAAARFIWEETAAAVGFGDGNSEQSLRLDNGNVLRVHMGNNLHSLAYKELDSSGEVVVRGGQAQSKRMMLHSPANKTVALSALTADERGFGGFTTFPVALSSADPTGMRVLVGFWGLYESTDRGETAKRIVDVGEKFSALAYGGTDSEGAHADVIYAARGNEVYVRRAGETKIESHLVAESSLGPGLFSGSFAPAGKIRDIALDPQNWKRAFVAASNGVYMTTDAGENWIKISQNLGEPDPKSVEFVEGALLVGGATGVRVGFNPARDMTFVELGVNLPNALAQEVAFFDRPNTEEDVLVVGTFGRGAWTLYGDPGDVLDPSRIEVTGTTGNDLITLRRSEENASFVEVLVNSANPVLRLPLESLTKISVSGLGGDDIFTVDSTHGALSVPEGIAFTGDAGDQLVFEGVKVWSKDRDDGAGRFEITEAVTDAEQVVTYTGIPASQIQDNLAEASTWEKIGAWLREVFDFLPFVDDAPGRGADSQFAIVGSSLPRAVQGVDMREPEKIALPSASDDPVALDDAQKQGRGWQRVFETGEGGFSLSDIGRPGLNSLQELEAALEALDSVPNNVKLTESGGTTRFDVQVVKRLAGSADFDFDLPVFGGSVEIGGLLDLSAELVLDVAFGIDASGLFLDVGGAEPELLLHKIELEGDVGALGRFGFLEVELALDLDASSVAPTAALEIDLAAPSGNLVRLGDLPGLASLSALGVRSGSGEDLKLVAKIKASSHLDGLPSPIDLAGAKIQLLWGDIAKPTEVKVSAVAGLGQDVIDFLEIGSQEVLDRLTELRDLLGGGGTVAVGDEAFAIEIPFLESQVSKLIGFAEAFDKRVIDPLTSPVSGTASFPTAQELATKLSEGLGVDAANLELAYDGLEKELTYKLAFSEVLEAVDLQGFGFELDELAELQLSTQGTLNANADFQMELGIDLGKLRDGPTHFLFLRNVSASGSLLLDATAIQASARLGPLDVEVVDGSGSASPTFSLTLLDPGTHTQDGRIDLGELIDALANDPSALIGSPTIGGSASFDLPLAAPFLGIDASASTMLQLSIADLANPTDVQVVVPEVLRGFGDFSNLSVLQIVLKVGELFDTLDVGSLLDFEIPFTGVNLGGSLESAFDLVDDLTDAEGNPDFDSLASLSDKLDAALGIDVVSAFDPGTQTLTYQFDDAVSAGLGENVGFRFGQDLGPFGGIEASGDVTVVGDLDLNFLLGIDFSPIASVIEGTQDASGSFTGDAVFDLQLDADEAQEVRVTAPPSGTLDDLLHNINIAIAAAGLGESVLAERAGNRVRLRTLGFEFDGAAPTLSLTASAGNPAVTALGLPESAIDSDLATDHLFLRDVRFATSLSVGGGAGIDNARFGFVELTGGLEVEGQAGLDFTLTDPGSGADADGRITAGEIQRVIASGELSQLGSPTFTGSAQFDVTGIGAKAGGVDLGIQPAAAGDYQIRVSVPDLADPVPEIDMDEDLLAGLFDLQNLEFDGILGTLQTVLQAVESLAGEGFLATEIPGIGVSAGDLVDFAQDLTGLIEQFQDDPQTFEQFADVLAPYGVALDFELHDGVPGLVFTLTPGASDTSSLDLNFDLGGLHLLEVTSEESIHVTAGLGGSVKFGIDLADPANPRPFVDATSNLQATLLAVGQPLDLDVTVLSALPLFIRNGHVVLDDGSGAGTNPASFGIGFGSTAQRIFLVDANGDVDLSGLVGALEPPTVTGGLSIELPLFLDSAGTDPIPVPPDDTDAVVLLEIPDLQGFFDGSSSFEIEPENLTDVLEGLLADLDLLTLLSVGLDGLAGFFEKIGSAVDLVLDFEVPFVDAALSDLAALDFTGELITGTTESLATALSAASSLVGTLDARIEELADVLQSQLESVFPEALVELRRNELDEVRLGVSLGGSAGPDTIDLASDVGLPGLGLQIGGAASLQVDFDWDLDFEFGASVANGFFISTDAQAPEFTTDLSLELLDGAIDATLGLLGVEIVGRKENVSDLRDPAVMVQRGTGVRLGLDLNLLDPGAVDDGRLSVEELAALASPGQLVDVDVFGRAEAHLDLSLHPELLESVLPRITAEFDAEFALDEDGFGSASSAGFSNVQLDLASLFSETPDPNDPDVILRGFIAQAAEIIDQVLDPLDPVLDVLTARIPVLSDIKAARNLLDQDKDGKVTLVDAAVALGGSADLDFLTAAAFGVDLARSVGNLVEAVKGLSTSATIQLPELDLGALRLGDAGALDDFEIQVPDFSIQDLVSQVPTEIEGALESYLTTVQTGDKGGASFSLPLLDKPSSIFSLLLGRDTDLFLFDLPTMRLNFSIERFFPIIGPLGVEIGGNLSATADLGFGFDTKGIRAAIGAGGSVGGIAGGALEGFFLIDGVDSKGQISAADEDDRPEFILEAGIRAGGGVDVILAKATIDGSLSAEVTFDLPDGEGEDKDGRTRIHEFDACVFDTIEGEFTAGLGASLSIGIWPVKKTWRFTVAEVPLLDFSAGCDTSTENLATLSGGVLTLQTKDGRDDNFALSLDDAEIVNASGMTEVVPVVQVSGFGRSQDRWTTGAGDEVVFILGDIDRIEAAGTSGQDVIFIDSGIGIPADLDGGSGHDTLVGGSGNDTLKGGSGDDLLQGGPGDDELFSGTGHTRSRDRAADSLEGGLGDDTLDASANEDDTQINFERNAPWSLLDGGEGIDILIGGEGPDILLGGPGDDELTGGDDPLAHRAGFSNDPDDFLDGGPGMDKLWGGSGRDELQGGEGNDELRGGGDEDLLDGGVGADLLEGGADRDLLVGGADGDELYGHSVGGNDDSRDDLIGDLDPVNEDGVEFPKAQDDGDRETLDALAERGHLGVAGQPGDDQLYGQGGGDALFGQGGDDDLFGAAGDDTLRGGSGMDELEGGDGEDRLFGDSGNDTLRGGEKNDTLHGGADDDTLEGQDDKDDLFGDSGDDTLRGGDDEDTLHGGSGDDVLEGDAGDDDLYGGTGHDVLEGDAGDDDLHGEADGDTLRGGDDQDTLHGGTGDDVLEGGKHDDELYGDADDDRLRGDTGVDTLRGGSGTDILEGGADSDLLIGGFGNDTLYGHSESGADDDDARDELIGDLDPVDQHGVLFTPTAEESGVPGAPGDDVLHGQGGDDVLFGQGEPDSLFGGGGEDILRGGDGDDQLAGGADDDLLYGESQDDRLEGGAGSDVLFGGAEHDEIYGHTVTGAGDDDARDFLYGDFGLGHPDRDPILDGRSGDDHLFGQGGDDLVVGEEGRDTASGGGGDDLVLGDFGQALLDADGVPTHVFPLLIGTGGADDLSGDAGADLVMGGSRGDVLAGGSDGDVLIGDHAFIVFSGTEGRLRVIGGAVARITPLDLSDDTGGGDQILGGAGDDVAIGSVNAGGVDRLFGESGDDVLLGDNGELRFDEDGDVASFDRVLLTSTTLGGRDEISGGAGADLAIGGVAGDTLFGDGAEPGEDDGSDILIGDHGEVTFDGTYGRLLVLGSAVETIRTLDTTNDTAGADTLYGDDDDDVLLGGLNGDPAGIDRLFGGDGSDVLLADNGKVLFGEDDSLTTLDRIVSTDLGVGGDDEVSGGLGNDVGLGGAGADTLFGDGASADAADGTDILLGDHGEILFLDASGRLVVLGGAVETIRTLDTTNDTAGADTIHGNAGDDLLIGGLNGDPVGMDRVTGDAGDDVALGDNGEIRFGEDADLLTLDRILSTQIGVGGDDQVSGGAGSDIGIGGAGADVMFGDAETPGAADGSDVLLGDHGLILLEGAVGRLVVLGGAIATIRPLDTTNETAGADNVRGNAGDDILMGSLNGEPVGVDSVSGDAGDDLLFGDNGEVRFAEDDDLDTLDRILSTHIGVGGMDIVSGGAGADVGIGGAGGDTIFGDSDTPGATDGSDVLLGDHGEVLFSTGSGRLGVLGSAVETIRTTDDADETGGADTIRGDGAQDVVIGGVNGPVATPTDPPMDILFGGESNDVLLGDNGELRFGDDGDLASLDRIETRIYAEDGTTVLGGPDVLSGDAGDDVGLGAVGDDRLFGDDDASSAGAGDGRDALLGDNGIVELVGAPGELEVLGGAIVTLRTTDELEATGGVDTLSGNAGNDILAGGVLGDLLHGDADADVLLGDNARLEWLYAGDPDFAAIEAGFVFDASATTLDLVTTELPAAQPGGRDTIFGDTGSDLSFGGTDSDLVFGDDGDEVGQGSTATDLLFGDHGRLYPQHSTLPGFPSRNFFAIDTGDADGGAGDQLFGEEGDDVLLGQQGDDRMFGGSGDDDLVGGHNVAGGADELSAAVIASSVNPPVSDLIDGGTGDDALAGDNAVIWRTGDTRGERFRQLSGLTSDAGVGPLLYTPFDPADGLADGVPAVTDEAQPDPDGAVGRTIVLLDHTGSLQDLAAPRPWGDDLLAGGPDNDLLFGELGDDVLQGDGSIDPFGDADPAPSLAITTTDTGSPDTGETLVFNVYEATSDGDDYAEGGGGDDLIFGGLGQDDLIGGSSNLFGLATAELPEGDVDPLRPDGSDTLFGGAGADIARNHPGDLASSGHARDADLIAGDNATVFRIVAAAGDFETFRYDTYDPLLRIVPRGVLRLDYTPDGIANDAGAGDLAHGESGDDTLHGMTGGDVLYGDGQDDDVYGGAGSDWISGGTGNDGILGDDGQLRTSRNDASTEPLHGIAGLGPSELDLVIRTPGNLQRSVIQLSDALRKQAELEPFGIGQDDVLYGGLGDDSLHAGAGDDAVSGAEAPVASAFVRNPMLDADGRLVGERVVLAFDAITPDTLPEDVLGASALRTDEFALYDEFDPLRRVRISEAGGLSKDGAGIPFLLDFEAFADSNDPIGSHVHDGDDVLFGDDGADWLVGGTDQDHLYGGLGPDLLNADDDLATNDEQNDTTDAPAFTGISLDARRVGADVAYGGGGRDVLLANSGADRLIDWVGEYNSYLVPFAPFGAAAVSRTLQPQLSGYLYALSGSDGADPTRAEDAGTDAARNGEPAGELGLFRPRDAGFRDQTGAPDDPQAGNLPGGPRDVMAAEDFERADGTAPLEAAFAVESGQWSIEGGTLASAPFDATIELLGFYHLDHAQPGYMEIAATLTPTKVTEEFDQSNGYLIFDYQGATDYKFAGIDQKRNKLVIGHRTELGTVEDSTQTVRMRKNVPYDLLLALDGQTITAVLDGQTAVTAEYGDPAAEELTDPLNDGLIGLGTFGAITHYDDFVVQKLAPQIRFDSTEDFTGGTPGILMPRVGAWQVTGDALAVTTSPGNPSLATAAVDVAPASYLELVAALENDGAAGIMFDAYGTHDYKFALLSQPTAEVWIGHVSRGGLVVDASAPVPGLEPGLANELTLGLEGSRATLTLGEDEVLSHVFNALLNDGEVGLLALDGAAQFDALAVRGSDPDSSGPWLPGDFDGDGIVSESDFELLRSDLLARSNGAASTDLNRDGVVDIDDFNLFLERVETNTEPATAPEPAAEESAEQLVALQTEETVSFATREPDLVSLLQPLALDAAPQSSPEPVMVLSADPQYDTHSGLVTDRAATTDSPVEPPRISPTAQLEANVSVAAGVRIYARAEIGSGTTLGEGAHVGKRAQIGRWARIGAGARIEPGARVPDHSVVPPGAVVVARVFADRDAFPPGLLDRSRLFLPSGV